METPQFIFSGAFNIIREFLVNTFSYFSLKGLIASVVAVTTYLIGANDLALFAALMVMVGIEFLTQVLGDLSTAQNGRMGALLEALEKYSFRTAVQAVTYGLLASASHMTDRIVLDSDFLESMVISFLAVSQMIRIIKSAGRMGYTVPQAVLAWLEAYNGGETNIKDK